MSDGSHAATVNQRHNQLKDALSANMPITGRPI